jgi:hypothetical protein
MKKISLFLASLLVLGVSGFSMAQSQGAAFFPTDLTAQGQKAVQQIGDCVNSKRSLQVYYLIDGSGSLRQTDPKNLRAEVLATSLEQLAPREGSDIKVSYSVGTFGTKFRSLKRGWTEITASNAASEADWFRKTIPALTNEGNTNWEAGLQGAIDALGSAKADNPESCQVAVWLTDGGIDMGGNSSDFTQEARALENLCGVNPTSGANHGDAIINQLRSAKINVIGVLLRNQSVMDDLFSNKRAQYNGLNSTMSFMLPIVEGRGGVDGAAFGYSAEDYSCGSTGNALSAGAELVASNSLQLGLQFARVVARSNNGAPANVYGDNPAHFIIDPGVAYFDALIASNSWQLKNPKGKVVSTPNSGVKASVSAGAYLVRIPINSSADQGEWTIENISHNQADVFLYSGLDMKINVRNIEAGKPVGITGQILDKSGKPASLGVYGNAHIQLTSFNASSGVDANVPLNLDAASGTFSGTFLPPSGMTKATFDVTLQLTTKSGIKLSPVTLQQEARVALPPEYPHIQGTGLQLSVLTGTKGVSTGTLILEGSKLNDGEVCLSSPEVVIDPKPSRIPNFVWSKSGSGCIKVAQNQIVKVDYAVSNSTQSTGITSGVIPAVFKSNASGFEPINQQVTFEFHDKLKKNLWVFYAVLTGLMLLGLLIPMSILYFFGYRNSRILWGEGIQRVEVPVWINADGQMSRRDGKPIDGDGMGAAKGEYDWEGQATERLRSFSVSSQAGSVFVKGRASRNPFGDPVVVATASDGSRIITSLGNYSHDGKVGHIGVDIGQAWFLIASDYALSNPNERGQYEASAVSYIRHDASKGNGQATDRNIEMQSNTGFARFKDAVAAAQKPVEAVVEKQKKIRVKKTKSTPAVDVTQVENVDPFTSGNGGYSTSGSTGSSTTGQSTSINPTDSSNGGSSSNPFGGSY